MERNIEQYIQDYKSSDFEKVMVHYRRQQVLQSINQYPHHRILEIGCGEQPLFTEITDFDEYVVVEPASYFCDKAFAVANGKSCITVIQDFFENRVNELLEKQFDFIVVSALLHEVIDPQSLLDGIYQCCTDQTVVHINVPNSGSFHMLLAYESGIIPKIGLLSDRAKVLQQHTSFDLDLLKSYVTINKFIILDSGSYFIKLFNHEKMQRMIDIGILDSNILDGLNRMIKYIPDEGAEIYVNVKKK